MKRKLFVWLICILMAVMMSGCGNGDKKTSEMQPATSEKPADPEEKVVHLGSTSLYFKEEAELIGSDVSDADRIFESYKLRNMDVILFELIHQEYGDFPIVGTGEISNLTYDDGITMLDGLGATCINYIRTEDNADFFCVDVLISDTSKDYMYHFEFDMTNLPEDDDTNYEEIIYDIITNTYIEA